LATDPDASFRNAAEALDLAKRAAELSDNRDPAILDTLAAALAEAGRFTEAVETAQHALQLAVDQRNTSLPGKISARIKLYQSGSPFRDFQ
jgi:tetratricopeptide (TPR) repeat protein